MSKDEGRRIALIGQLTDHVLAQGLGSASLRPLARAVGTSDRMLLYYFPDKAALVTAVLEEVAKRMTVVLSAVLAPTPMPRATLERSLIAVLLADANWPYMALWLEIAGRAARGDAVCQRVGAAIGRGFLAWGAAQLDDPSDAARLMMAIEGAVVLKSLGMTDVVEAAGKG